MGFEVQPTKLGSTRWYARIAVALAIGAVIVGVGFAARLANPPAAVVDSTPAAAATGAPATRPSPAPPAIAAASRRPSPVPSLALSPRPLPADLTCHGLTRSDCLRAATAALGVLPPEVPPVATANIYANLICDSTFDCPQYRLSWDTVGLGSVTLTFVDGSPDAWINVVNRGPASNPAAVKAEAWVIRWRVAS